MSVVQVMPYPAAGGGAASATQWRILVTDNFGNSTVQIGEIEFEDAEGNAIATTGGTVIASNLGSEPTNNEAAKAFDGDPTGTRWGATPVANQWVGYEFASPVSVAQVVITNPNVADASVKNAALQYNNGGGWTTLFAFVGIAVAAVKTRYDQAEYDASAHRVWQIYRAAGRQYIANLELRDAVGGTDLSTKSATSNTPTAFSRILASGVTSGNDAFEAFDSDPSVSSWYHDTSGTTFLTYVFETPVTIAEVAMRVRFGSLSASNFDIRSSDDNVTFTVEKSVSGLSWSNGETKLFTVP